jgi:DNA-binding response OmpR family regulator
VIVPYHNINSLWFYYKGKLMKQKVIVADDSLTIQKVIKITLANESFELVECLSDENLFEKVESEKPVLALLDFNLSENKTGYDLAKELRAKGVSKILMLYGTFDTIDESLLDASGVGNYIVKPFEGTKFINQCRQMVEEVSLEQNAAELESTSQVTYEKVSESDEELEESEESIDDDFDEIDIDTASDDELVEEDQWVVNQPNIIEEDEEEIEEMVTSSEEFKSDISNDELNSLQAGMKDWGIDIPGVISEKSVTEEIELPPVINDSNVSSDSDKTAEFVFSELAQGSPTSLEETPVDNTLPKNNDLEYPDMNTIRESVAAEAPVSKLVSIDELSLEEDNSPREYDLDDTLGTKTEDEIRHLEAQIDEDDFAEEEPSENLWAADEVINNMQSEENISINDEMKNETLNENHLQDINNDLHSVNSDIQDQVTQDEVIKDEAIVPAAVGEIKLDESQILEYLEPVISKIIDARVEAILERIAWEVIPDLAENLIRKELKEISKGITRP